MNAQHLFTCPGTLKVLLLQIQLNPNANNNNEFLKLANDFLKLEYDLIFCNQLQTQHSEVGWRPTLWQLPVFFICADDEKDLGIQLYESP